LGPPGPRKLAPGPSAPVAKTRGGRAAAGISPEGGAAPQGVSGISPREARGVKYSDNRTTGR